MTNSSVYISYSRIAQQSHAVSQMHWFKDSGGNTTLADVQQMFLMLRKRGLRLHYWP